MRWNWKTVTFGIKRKILFSVVCFIFVMFTIEAVLLNLFIGNVLTDQFTHSLTAVGNQVVRSLDQNVNELKRLASGISLDNSVIKVIKADYVNNYEKVLAFNNVYNLLESNQEVRQYVQLYALSLPGHYMLSSDHTQQYVAGQKLDRLLELPVFRRIQQTPLDVMVIPEGLSDDTFTIAFRISGQSNEAAGYIMISCEKTYFTDLLQQSGMENTGVTITSADGQPIYHVPGAPDPEHSGERFIRNEQTSESTGWHVQSSLPYTQVETDLRRFRWLLFSVMAVLTMMLLGVLIWIIRRITQSLSQLSKTIKLVESNNFNVQFNAASNDEVGKVGHMFNRMVAETNHLINELVHTKVLATEAKLSALQQQINPHYLYNALGVINSLAAVNRIGTIQTIAQNLADMFRYNMDGQARTLVTIQQEIEHVEKYLLIQKKMMGERLQYRIEADPELGRAGCLKFMLQPIVENCFTHAFEDREGVCRIDIRIRRTAAPVETGEDAERKMLLIEVEDNGRGMEQSRLEEVTQQWNWTPTVHDELPFSHIGLQNVHWRIVLTYGDAYGIRLSSQPDCGCLVRLYLPLGNEGDHP